MYFIDIKSLAKLVAAAYAASSGGFPRRVTNIVESAYTAVRKSNLRVGTASAAAGLSPPVPAAVRYRTR